MIRSFVRIDLVRVPNKDLDLTRQFTNALLHGPDDTIARLMKKREIKQMLSSGIIKIEQADWPIKDQSLK